MPDTLDHPAIRRVLDAAARKGVSLKVTIFPASTHTAEDAAAAVGAEIGQIVKSLVFVAVAEDGRPDPVLCLVSGANRVDLARLSAVTGKGTQQILPACSKVYDQYTRQIQTSELNTVVHSILNRVRPAATSSGAHVKFYYAAQIGSRPPSFALFVNNPRYIKEN